jgi:hypothetical protein
MPSSEELASLRDLCDRSLYATAYELAKPFGPLRLWKGTEGSSSPEKLAGTWRRVCVSTSTSALGGKTRGQQRPARSRRGCPRAAGCPRGVGTLEGTLSTGRKSLQRTPIVALRARRGSLRDFDRAEAAR